MGRISFIFLLVLFTITGFAQKENNQYNDRAKEIQKVIWQDTSAAFRVTQIPVELNNESAVIIAKYYEIVNTATAKYKNRVGELQSISSQVTFRQRVKINDKIALENYSSLDYIKSLDLSFSYRFSRIHNKIANYIGAKIIKPGGTEMIINSNEEVLTKDENKNKEAKLAIPGLQVGDILDYYIKREEMVETPNSITGPYSFFMNGEYPVLFYSIKLQLDTETGVRYISANGAPSLNERTNEDGDIILELTQTNLTKYNSSLFTSPFRQYPYISLQFQRATRGYDFYADLARGQVRQGNHSREMVDKLIKRINGLLNTRKAYPLTLTQNYFGGEKIMNDMPKDSIVNVLYNAWRYVRISALLKNDEYLPDDIKYSYALSLDNAVFFSKMLTSLDIDNTIYLVCSRNSGSIQNIMNLTDFSALLKVKADKNYWIGFDDIFTQLNEIPMRFQGEEAITLQPEKIAGIVSYTAGQGKVPLTIPAYNSISENLEVTFDPSNMNMLKISRNCRQTGALRHDYQKQLLLTEDIVESMLANINQKKKPEEKISDDRRSQLSAVFNNERNNLKTSFEAELSHRFTTSPKNLTGYEIIQPGLYSYSIPFEYKSSFFLENYVKKAGTNYIVEVGRLIGDRVQVDEKKRNRNIDIFLSCPMTFNWAININIPAGYGVKGVEELNKTIKNETGSFSCTATIDGQLIKIQISEVYAHNFEKASNWPKLLELMEAMNNIYTQKILLEKI